MQDPTLVKIFLEFIALVLCQGISFLHKNSSFNLSFPDQTCDQPDRVPPVPGPGKVDQLLQGARHLHHGLQPPRITRSTLGNARRTRSARRPQDRGHRQEVRKISGSSPHSLAGQLAPYLSKIIFFSN